jgi:hypothetical protein
MSDNLESLVFIALGEASMCWSNIDKAGVFETSRCAEIGQRLVSEINSVLKPQTSVDGGAVNNSTQQANTPNKPQNAIATCSICQCELDRRAVCHSCWVAGPPPQQHQWRFI